ncbi:acetyl-CoA C-acetyltransferase [Polaromonas sp. OV174]|uniref:thiolase family protein n=1 Tax=Polaromonas sp. OV174 TaxID=1855300 RepID=UPI0008E9B737|nr:thiolase family protein [Polaromonas sp. OV174]SFC52394.1 acetyl-CoA C-acetyltransferase [Polaromonas sp. OV174]
MAFSNIFLSAGARTPFGDYGKSLKNIPLNVIGTHVVKACISRAGIDSGDVDNLVFGNVGAVDHDSAFISRKVALQSGMKTESAALSVTRACGTGSQAIVSAAMQILTKHSSVAIAAGGENFSRAPYISPTTRWGAGRGESMLVDGLDYVYRCPFSRELMGETAENLSQLYGYGREDMDDWAFMSQQRAKSAEESGFLAKQIVPLEVTEGKNSRLFEKDEFPRPNVLRGRLSELKPAFRTGGVVTAGNSSGVTDGGAAIMVFDDAAIKRHGLSPQAKLIDYAVEGVPPHLMGMGPVPAIATLLRRNGLGVADIDYFEINEAFSVVNLHAEKELQISRDKTNLYGGGISIGHPPGATGIRMTMTAIQHLEQSGGRYAVISMCLGSGMGMATLIERVNS